MKNAAQLWRGLLGAFRARSAAPARIRTGRVYRRLRLERLEPRLAPAARDTLATALPLTFDVNEHAQVAGTLADANQVDLYALSLNAGDEVAADLRAQNAADLVDYLRLFDSSGRQLALVEIMGNADSSLIFAAPLAGVYYVGVSSTGGLTTGSYTLTLTRSSGLVTENSPNDTLATAQALSGNTVLQGTYVPGITTYYAFNVTGAGSLPASVIPAGATIFLPRLALYGAAVQLLTQPGAMPLGVPDLSLPPIMDLPSTAPFAQSTSLPGADLVLVATLVSRGLEELVPANQAETIPAVEVFVLFLAPMPGQSGGAGLPGQGGGAMDVGAELAAPVPGPNLDVAGWEVFRLGATEALDQRLQRQQASDRLEDFLDAFRDLLDQIPRWFTPPAALPGTPMAQCPSQPEPLATAVVENHADREAPDPSADRSTSVSPGERDSGEFLCVEWMPATTAPQTLPEGKDSEPQLPLGDGAHGDARSWHGLASGPKSVSPFLAAAVFAIGVLPRKQGRHLSQRSKEPPSSGVARGALRWTVTRTAR